jgi:hypothetical protein
MMAFTNHSTVLVRSIVFCGTSFAQYWILGYLMLMYSFNIWPLLWIEMGTLCEEPPKKVAPGRPSRGGHLKPEEMFNKS